MTWILNLLGGKTAAIIVGVVALAIAIGGAALYFQHIQSENEALTTQTREQSAEIAAQNRNGDALENASIAREADTSTIAVSQKERDDEIAKAPAGAPGAATLAANCVRWKAQHPHATAPAACRRPQVGG